jgi:hypothetical protein
MIKRLVGTLGVVVAMVLGASLPVIPVAAAGPGSHSATDVNNAIEAGVAYLDTQQNPDGSFGSSGVPVSETAFAIIAYGVSDRGDFNNLSAARKTIVSKGVDYLLAQQDATTGNQTSGSWSDSGLTTYPTGLSLTALSFSTNANAGIPNAIARGRAALIAAFQGPSHNPPVNCTTDPNNSQSTYCGGFTYDYASQEADASNTGFGMTGLKLSGGVPADIVTLNTGWQRNVQEMATNPRAFSTDGGGDYQPGRDTPPCCPRSNALSTGSMLFGYGYDNVPATDAGVAAGLKFGQDILDVYELTKADRRGVYHTGATEDGACNPNTSGCTWTFEDTGEGGYHYSLWGLSKGLGEFLSPDLADANNWYAKVADILLTQQAQNGSWPQDGRDDNSVPVATAFAIFALGLAATPPAPVGNLAITTGSQCGAAQLSWTNPSTSNYGGVEIRRKTGSYPTSETDGAQAGNVPAPGTSFLDQGLTNGTTYYYSAFSYDTSGQLFGAPANATATPACPPGLPEAGSGQQPSLGSAWWLGLLLAALAGGGLASGITFRRRRQG